ncbi:hypothetical protein KAI78_07260 [bacterium]|nr:hypothetical protein [bacterium]
MDKWKKEEKRFIEERNIENSKYEKIDSMLSSIRTASVPETQHSQISFSPLSERLRRLIFWRRARYVSFAVVIYTLGFNAFFLKNIIQWTDISRALRYFFIFLASKWLEYMGEFAFKTFSLIHGIMSNQLAAVLLLFFLMLPFVVYRLKTRLK